MPEDATRRSSRTDEIKRPSPEQVEHDFEREGPSVQRNDDLKGAERMPRLGNEEDKPYNDALGG
jgi:hypothetical protein